MPVNTINTLEVRVYQLYMRLPGKRLACMQASFTLNDPTTCLPVLASFSVSNMCREWRLYGNEAIICLTGQLFG